LPPLLLTLEPIDNLHNLDDHFFFAKIGARDGFEMPLTLELYKSYTHDHKYNGLEHKNICVYIYIFQV